MEPDTCGKGDGPEADRCTRPLRRPEMAAAGRVPERHLWALAALAFPLAFCAIVALGVYLMFHRNMGYFKPAPSGWAAPPGEHRSGAHVA